MNYFAHGRSYVEDPYFLAGTAAPDWLSVVDRRVRARRQAAARAAAAASDPRAAAVARGVVQHHEDDARFHAGPAFAACSAQLAARVRPLIPPDAPAAGLQAGFLGHLLVEVLLDAELIRRAPGLLDRYYAALDQLDPHVVRAAVEQIAGRPCPLLAPFIPRFAAERLLYDYGDDGKLQERLDRVLRRVGLSPLPRGLAALLPDARRLVRRRRAELLDGRPRAPQPGPAAHSGDAS